MKLLMSIFVFALIVLDVVDGKFKVSKLTDSDGGINDAFGFAVTVNRDAIVVGSYLDDVGDQVNAGSINVFSIDGKLKKKITSGVEEMGEKSNTDNRFGASVALNAKYILVGNIQDAPSFKRQGSVYIYNYADNQDDWAYKKIVAADGGPGDQFGVSVAINEMNDVVVGTPFGDTKGSNAGAAYVFSYIEGTWVQQQKLLPLGLSQNAEFGNSVAITDSHMAVGTHYVRYRDIYESGMVYIYKKNTGALWERQTRLASPRPKIYGRFGCAVSMYGNRVVIGAYGEGDNRNTGKAYVFVNNVGNIWRQEAVLTANDGKESKFGFSVSMYQHAIIIGAPQTAHKNPGKGSVYVFELINGTTWTLSSKFVAGDGRNGDGFGVSVSIFTAGNARLANAVVGSPGNDVQGTDSGAVYLYNGLNFLTNFTKIEQPTSDSNKIACHGLYVYLFVYFVYLFV